MTSKNAFDVARDEDQLKDVAIAVVRQAAVVIQETTGANLAKRLALANAVTLNPIQYAKVFALVIVAMDANVALTQHAFKALTHVELQPFVAANWDLVAGK